MSRNAPSWGRVPRAVLTDQGLSAQDRLVLALLCTHADKDGWCTRKQGAIADELGCHRNSVNRSIKRLISRGRLESAARPGMKRSLRYRVLDIVALATDDAQTRMNFEGDDGASVAPPNGASVAPPSATAKEQTPVNRPPLTAQRARDPDPVKTDPVDDTPSNVIPLTSPGADELRTPLLDAAGNALHPAAALMLPIDAVRWVREGATVEEIVAVVGSKCAGRPPCDIRSSKYFEAAIFEARDRRLAGPEPPRDRRPPRQTPHDRMAQAFDNIFERIRK